MKPYKNIKREKCVTGPEKLVHSNEILLNDRIDEMVIYKESTDPVKSIDLYEYRCSTPPLPEIEVFDAIVSLETGSTKTPNYTFEIKKTYTENFSTRKVSCITYFDVKIVYCSKPFLLVKSRDKSNDISGES